jgi:hypothetical protein
MRWPMCLRANNLVAIAALILLAQREFSPRCISPQDICLYLGSVLHNCFGSDSPDAENVAMPLLAFNTGQYYTPVCLLVSMHP